MTDLSARHEPADLDADFEAELQEILDGMEEAIRDGMPGAAALIDQTPKGSVARQMLIGDLMRGSSHRFSTQSVLSLLRDIGDWVCTKVTDQEVTTIGDSVCEIDIAGEAWPCVIFGAMGSPFDDKDPLLRCMADHLRAQTGRACLLHPHPLFQSQADDEGEVVRFVLFGGWLIDAEGCRPFCVQSGGTDGLPAQTRLFQANSLNEDFFRTLGHDGKALPHLLDAKIAIDRQTTSQRLDPWGLGGMADLPSARLSRQDYTITTDDQGWSYFVNSKTVREVHELQGMMAGIDMLEGS